MLCAGAASLALLVVSFAPVGADAQFPLRLPPVDGAAPPAEVRWIEDPAEAVAQARRSGRPIVAYVTSSHCGYCRKMERESWSEPAIARIVEGGLVPLKLSADTHPEEVAALRVKAFPTTVLLTPEGRGFAGAQGYLPPAKLAELLRPSRQAGAAAPRPPVR